ncbi:MAG: hypothetical protein PHU14_01480 [Methylovulum sp.]|nr:hypothetical protein [Methylovulum sp.]
MLFGFMIALIDLEQIARDKLVDADCLFKGNRFDGAVYLAGYALEIALKVRLCKNNGLSGFPENSSECDKLTKQWFSHSLIKLESHSGLNLSSSHLTEWSIVKNWDVEARYKNSQASRFGARDFLDSVQTLLAIII